MNIKKIFKCKEQDDSKKAPSYEQALNIIRSLRASDEVKGVDKESYQRVLDVLKDILCYVNGDKVPKKEEPKAKQKRKPNGFAKKTERPTDKVKEKAVMGKEVKEILAVPSEQVKTAVAEKRPETKLSREGRVVRTAKQDKKN